MRLVTLRVSTMAVETPRSRLLTLDLDGLPFDFAPGQAVLLAQHGAAERRPYSIACSPGHAAATGCLEFLVAVDETGEFDWAVKGALADIEGPLGTFTLPDAIAGGRLLFVAGGTGIAPLRAMLDHSLRSAPARPVSVLYSARGPDEFAFIAELRKHEKAGRIELQQTVTRDASASWLGRRGRIGRVEFENVLHEPGDTMCFVCGPPSMVSETVATLQSMGVPPYLIRIEKWGTS